MLSTKTIVGYIVLIFIIFISLAVGYKLGESNSSVKTEELNATLLGLLARRSDLPFDDIDLGRIEYGDMSYFPFNLETNILDYAYIQFSGVYIPTGKHFSLRHHINIYKPGNVPNITATETLYNDSIARNGRVKLLSLSVLDDNSWGFCYTESYTCFIESQYDDLLSVS